MDGFIGEVRAFGFNYQTDNWIPCDGRALSVHSYPALFSVIGTTYGGDGVNVFNVPDFRGYAPMHAGSATGTIPVAVGQNVGVPSVTLTMDQTPSHTHDLNVVQKLTGLTLASAPSATAYPALPRSTGSVNYDAWTIGDPDTNLDAGALAPAGAGAAHSNVSPYLTMFMCIAYDGVYPVRQS